jgi:hypothetical protein
MEKLEKLIRKLCSMPASNDQLDGKLLMELYDILKSDKSLLPYAMQAIQKSLQKQHAQFRYNCLLIIEGLFRKSSLFRDLLLAKSKIFMQAIFDEKVEPSDWAVRLRCRAYATVKEWNEMYRNSPRLVGLWQAVSKLELQSTNSVEDSQAAFSKKLRLEKYLKFFENEYSELVKDSKEQLRLLNHCILLLVPDMEGCAEEDLLVSNVIGKSYSIEVELSKPQYFETDENHVIYDNLRENILTLNKTRTKLSEHLKQIIKVHDPDQYRQEVFIKEMVDLKNEMSNTLKKGNELLDYTTDMINSDEDEIFEEVGEDEKDGQMNRHPDSESNSISKHSPFIINSTGLKSVFGNCRNIGNGEEVVEIDEQNAVDSIPEHIDIELKELFTLAPVVPYDEDLHYWSKTNLSFNEISANAGVEFHHRFLGDGPTEKPISEESLAALKKRNIYLEPISKTRDYPQCRYPLPNGKLCPRKDMEKCPFHGSIILRDEKGIPVDPQQIKIGTTRGKQLWETIEPQFQLTSKSVKKEGLDPIIKPKKSVQKRILKKVNRLEKKRAIDTISNITKRDREAFRW